jgi:hypothetical protein
MQCVRCDRKARSPYRRHAADGTTFPLQKLAAPDKVASRVKSAQFEGETSMAKGQEKPKKDNQKKLTIQEKQKKKKEKQAAKGK